MGLRVATNSDAMMINRSLSQIRDEQSKSYQRLASGKQIVQAGDDPAGLAISETLRAEIRSMAQAEKNANFGISYVQVAEGALTEVSNMLVRLRELGIQAASDTVGDDERGFINQEAQMLVQEIDRIANVTNFNGTPLLNGESKKNVLDFQVGIHNTENDRILFDTSVTDSRAGTLGVDNLDYTSVDDARDTLEKIDKAMKRVFSTRGFLGSLQSRIHSTINTLESSQENFALARSQIADTDIASETSDLVRQNILQSAGIAVLAQANTNSSQALKLL